MLLGLGSLTRYGYVCALGRWIMAERSQGWTRTDFLQVFPRAWSTASNKIHVLSDLRNEDTSSFYVFSPSFLIIVIQSISGGPIITVQKLKPHERRPLGQSFEAGELE